MHELGPILELRPLVVGGLERHRHVDRLLHRHPPALSDSWHAALSAAVASGPGQQTASGLLDQPAGAAGFVDLVRDRVLEVGPDLVPGLGGNARRRLGGVERRKSAVADLVCALLGERRGDGGEAGSGRDALGARQAAATALLRRRRVAHILDGFADRVAERASYCITHVLRHRTPLPSNRLVLAAYPSQD